MSRSGEKSEAAYEAGIIHAYYGVGRTVKGKNGSTFTVVVQGSVTDKEIFCHLHQMHSLQL